MSVGIGIFLLVLGAILTWAVDFNVAGLDITTIGMILLVAGALTTLLSLVFLARGRRTTAVTHASAAGAAPGAAPGAPAAGTSERVTEVRQEGGL